MLYQRTEQGLSRFQGELPDAAAAAIERADEEAIVAALGDQRFAGEYLYHVEVEGRDLVGVSAEGAFEMARLLGNIEMLPDVRTDRDASGYYVLVRVRDNLRRVTLLGAARQPLRARATGQVDEDAAGQKGSDHAWSAAVSKAQRNGILRLVSPECRQRIIEGFLARERQAARPAAVAATGSGAGSATTAAGESSRAQAALSTEGGPSAPMATAGFAAGCRQKGYRTSAEVCSALGLPDKGALVRCGLARALEKLPDRNEAGHVEAAKDVLDEVDLGF